MVRFHLKGGVWKNTEDEILKAAVMKYGKNQWSRISSLIVRKSAKQCKARWFEWLDPSIKKTEWTREEEERLLHLAKIMPTQWRTIAPMIGRTAAQCLEHYEKLLDAAQQDKSAADYDPREDPRRLKPGEIDPLPEAKPARPDAIDMDEDEKEMLSEARARLANTKGKKAKRKAREKQLEEARRLASLQKQRELKAAGIEVHKFRKKRKGAMDYNEEIPFEKKAPVGFFPTLDEKKQGDQIREGTNFLNINLDELEGKRRSEVEADERKKDAKRIKLFREQNLPEHLEKLNRLNDPEQIRRRMNMSLPAPQISDKELETLAKIQNTSMMPPPAPMGPTRALLANYGTTPAAATPMRTPMTRTPMQKDTILQQTQNLIALTTTQTPLLGGENAPLQDSDFSGVQPKKHVPSTPNPLATPSHPSATPALRTAPTPLRPGSQTPVRDQLHINETVTGLTSEQAIIAGNIRAEKRRAKQNRVRLVSALSSLPAPVNEYALVMPELPPEPDHAKGDDDMIEDAEDIAATQQQRHAEAAALLWKRQSQVIQRNLPRPMRVNGIIQDDNRNEVDTLVEHEMIQLLNQDARIFPMDKKIIQGQGGINPPFTDEELEHARFLIHDQISSMSSDILQEIPNLDLSDSWLRSFSDFIFLPTQKQYGSISSVSHMERIAALTQILEHVRQQRDQEQAKATKVENKINVLTKGYRDRVDALRQQLQTLITTYQQQQQDIESFQRVMTNEEQSIPIRLKSIKDEVYELTQAEKSLQSRYQSLIQQKETLEHMLM